MDSAGEPIDHTDWRQ